MLDFGKTLENLKKRFMNSAPDGRAILRDVLLGVASASGKYDEIADWIEKVEMGTIGQEEEVKDEKVEEVVVPPAETPEPETPPEPPEEKPEEKEEPVSDKVEEVPEKVEEVKKEIETVDVKNILSDISKTIKTLQEKIEDIEDAVGQHKRILEKITGTPSDFEKKKKKLEDSDVITPQEFGIRFYGSDDEEDLNKNAEIDKNYIENIRRSPMSEETRELIEKGSKEKDLSPTARRKARLRNSGLISSAQEEKPRTLKDYYKVPEDIEKMKKLPQIPETPYVTKEQLEERKRKEKEKSPLWLKNITAEYNEDRKTWVISYEGKPLYEVSYSKEISPSEEDFASRAFGKVLLKDFIHDGEDTFIKKYNARIVGQEEKEEKKEEEKPEEEKSGALRDIEMKFLKALDLSRKIMDKNLVEHPLKSALYETLKKAGVRNAVAVIENAFRIAGDKYFDTLIGLARKYSGMDAKTFAEVSAFVESAKAQIPVESEEDTVSREEVMAAQELRRRAEEGSIPLLTGTIPYDPLKDAVPKPSNWVSIPKKGG